MKDANRNTSFDIFDDTIARIGVIQRCIVDVDAILGAADGVLKSLLATPEEPSPDEVADDGQTAAQRRRRELNRASLLVSSALTLARRMMGEVEETLAQLDGGRQESSRP